MKAYWSVLLLLTTSVHAHTWQELWLTPDQLGQQAMQAKEYLRAKHHFKDKAWLATASYRARDYKAAASMYESLNNANGFYNAGNAYAKMKRYTDAIKAYDQALKHNPKHQWALQNKKIIEQLLKSQPPKSDKQRQQSPNKLSKSSQPNQSPSNSNANQDQHKTRSSKPAPTESHATPSTQQAQEKPVPEPKKEAGETLKQKANNAAEHQKQEQENAKAQWLQMIPDDPGGLLREKFLRDYQKNHALSYD